MRSRWRARRFCPACSNETNLRPELGAPACKHCVSSRKPTPALGRCGHLTVTSSSRGPVLPFLGPIDPATRAGGGWQSLPIIGNNGQKMPAIVSLTAKWCDGSGDSADDARDEKPLTNRTFLRSFLTNCRAVEERQ